MANGFFLGGMAEGMQNSAELGLKRDALTAETGLKTRGLDLQERQIGQTGELQRKQLALQEQSQQHAASREVLTRADKQIDDTMTLISETIKGAIDAGKDPIIVQKAVAPLLESAKSLAAKAGRSPDALDAQVTAQLVRPISAETQLKTRQVDIQDRTQRDAQTRADTVRTDQQISDSVSVLSEAIKLARAAGQDTAAISQSIAPLVQSAKSLAAKAGRDPTSIDAQVAALVAQPSGVETAEATGANKGTAAVAEAKALAAGGVEPGFKEIKDKVAAENSLRDDYLKQAGTFITIRDGKNRLDSLEKSGAGDMSLVFQFMKMLDPTSTVREGEYASAANSGGVPSAIQGYYNKALGEGVIGDKARKDILKQANSFYEKAAVQHDKLTTQFFDIAKRQKLNPDNVTVNLLPAGADEWQTTPGNTKFRIAK